MYRHVGPSGETLRIIRPSCGLKLARLGLKRGSAAGRSLGLQVRILPRSWMPVSCECCVLTIKGLCYTRLEESYRVWCVSVWSWSVDNESLAHWGLLNARWSNGGLRCRDILPCGNKMPTRCNRGFCCRSYFLLNMFRAPLCSSSGAQEYYTVVAACGISCCVFQAIRSAIKTSVASSWHFISTY